MLRNIQLYNLKFSQVAWNLEASNVSGSKLMLVLVLGFGIELLSFSFLLSLSFCCHCYRYCQILQL